MDLLDYNLMKTQKSNYTFRYTAKVLRILELCLVLVLILWVFNKLPFAVKLSGEFLQYIAGVISSPLFVFFLCNVIIATLVAKSGKFTCDETGDNEIYDEFLGTAPTPQSENSPVKVQEALFRDKEIILEPSAIVHEPQATEKYSDLELDTDSAVKNLRLYRRTKSEKLKVTKTKILRRYETEKLPERSDDEVNLTAKDELSDEDFQRTVDEFIKKQRSFLCKESFVDNHCFVAVVQ